VPGSRRQAGNALWSKLAVYEGTELVSGNEKQFRVGKQEGSGLTDDVRTVKVGMRTGNLAKQKS
jgi:hypothetical protein